MNNDYTHLGIPQSPTSSPARRSGGTDSAGCLTTIVTVAVVLLVLAAIVAFAAIWVRNGLVEKSEAVSAQWSEIDNQLLRRADLIPNLVATVKGYAQHEEDIFKAVADARSALLAASSAPDKAAADSALDASLSRLLAIAESYPELKANENFARLQDELAGTENRIAVARTRYNEAAQALNAALRKFPESLFVPGLGLEKADYFQPPADAPDLQHPPTVAF